MSAERKEHNSELLDDQTDHSVLQQPLNLGIKNVKQILKCIQSGSREVKDIILNECNIIYECKVCLSLFRSLANFLYHKRCFCKTHLCENMLLFENFSERQTEDSLQQLTDEAQTEQINVSTVCDTVFPPSEKETSAASSDVDVVGDQSDMQDIKLASTSKDDIDEMESNFEDERKRSSGENLDATSNLSDTFSGQKSIFTKLIEYPIALKKTRKRKSKTPVQSIALNPESPPVSVILKPIEGNSNATFQELQKNGIGCGGESQLESKSLDAESTSHCEVAQPNTIARNNEANAPLSINKNDVLLTRRKRLLNRTDCDLHTLTCLNCNTDFTTLKTLYFHMMSLHSHKRMYYPCPYCNSLFVQMYGVTRHLLQIHGKTKDQINNKLRESIRKGAVWRHVDNLNLENDEVEKSEDTWIANNDPNSQESIPEHKVFHSYVKMEHTVPIHHCTKCQRVFGRKSSQVSHEKFCIMNTSGRSDVSEHHDPLPLEVDVKPIINARPKRGAEKQMHKDFVNSQTLKWRSANKIGARTIAVTKSSTMKTVQTHERKMVAIMDSEKLLCLKCNRTFSNFSNLRRHAAIHIGFTRYKCNQCDYQSYNRSDCRHHVERMHSVTDDLDIHVVQLQSEKKESPKELYTKQQTASFQSVGRKRLMGHKNLTGGKRKLTQMKSVSEKKSPEKSQKRGKKSASNSPDQLPSKVQINYKSVTTNSPTTIILSKTCSSSTVHVTKSTASVPFQDRDTSTGKKLNKLISCKSGPENSPGQTSTRCGQSKSKLSESEKPYLIIKTNNKKELDSLQVSEKTYAKRKRSINEWFMKRPITNSTERRKEPLIIGLVPAQHSLANKTTAGKS